MVARFDVAFAAAPRPGAPLAVSGSASAPRLPSGEADRVPRAEPAGFLSAGPTGAFWRSRPGPFRRSRPEPFGLSRPGPFRLSRPRPFLPSRPGPFRLNRPEPLAGRERLLEWSASGRGSHRRKSSRISVNLQIAGLIRRLTRTRRPDRTPDHRAVQREISTRAGGKRRFGPGRCHDGDQQR